MSDYQQDDKSLFLSLDSSRLASEIFGAEKLVCYAAPGILQEPAEALAAVAKRFGPELITVCLDFDERVMRMGFGTLEAIKTLREAGIQISSIPGFRTGMVIVDDDGFIFTPTALYLEAEGRSDSAPNAMRLARDQIAEALARLSPAAKAIAIAFAKTDEDRERLRSQAVEVQSFKVEDSNFKAIEKRLKEVPPVDFDVARQVRVFNAYMQYVELNFTGAAIQRHRLAIPPSLQKLGGSKDLDGRLKTTFDLIEKSGKLSSKPLDRKLTDIRNDFTPSLGKDHGRVVLKIAKPRLEELLDEFRRDLKAHQENVRTELQSHLDESRKQIAEYYLPLVVLNPPDSMRGQFLDFGEDEATMWLNTELDRVFPKAETLVQKMQLDVRFKDVTFETLNKDDFLESVKAAFPALDWDAAYEDYRAAGETKV